MKRRRKYLGKYMENYQLEIPFYSFVVCDEDGDDDNDDIVIGFRI